MDLSIVIPAYNEERSLARCLTRVRGFASARGLKYEILVVNDGSTDGTAELVRGCMGDRRDLQLLSNGYNRGKGYVVKQGVLAARGDIVLFMDADLSTPVEEWDQMREWFEKGFSVVIGTRRTAGARIERHQPFLREWMGRVFTSLSRGFTGTSVSDFTCGFKTFSREAAREIFSRQTLDDWSFDAEILCIASRRGIKVKEVPVQWSNAGGSRVHLLRDALRSFLGLLKVRFNILRRLYD